MSYYINNINSKTYLNKSSIINTDNSSYPSNSILSNIYSKNNFSGISVSLNSGGNLGTIKLANDNISFALKLKQNFSNAISLIKQQLLSIKGNIQSELDKSSSPHHDTSQRQSAIELAINGIDVIADNFFKQLEINTNPQNFTLKMNSIPTTIENAVITLYKESKIGAERLDMNLTSPPKNASIGFIAPVQSQASTVEIEGPLGKYTFNFEQGATSFEVADQINKKKNLTGVNVIDRKLYNIIAGKSEFININEISGNFEFIPQGRFTGENPTGSLNAAQGEGQNYGINFNSTPDNAYTSISTEANPGIFSFRIFEGGLEFQIGSAQNSETYKASIPFLYSNTLGFKNSNNSLSTLKTNNSLFSNPLNAYKITLESQNSVNTFDEELNSVLNFIINESIQSAQDALNELIEDKGPIKDGNIADIIADNTMKYILNSPYSYKSNGLSLNAQVVFNLLYM